MVGARSHVVVGAEIASWWAGGIASWWAWGRVVVGAGGRAVSVSPLYGRRCSHRAGACDGLTSAVAGA